MILNLRSIDRKHKKYIKSNKDILKPNIINKIGRKRIINNSNISLIIFLIMITPSFLSKQTKISELIADNEITIVIKGTGIQKILGDNYQFTPSQIYLNDNPLGGDKTVYGLTSEPNTVRMIWGYPLSHCISMFYCLDNIIEIDLSKFDSSQVTDISDMFHGCSSLTSINFTNMNTLLVTGFMYVFYQCHKLKSLDLSSFDTSLATSMYEMFYECYALETLNISSFNTQRVTSMERMFYRCHSLKSLDIRNFDTSSVTNMILIFSECKTLQSLDLSSFDTSQLTEMSDMFRDCNGLISLDIRNFDTSSVVSLGNMFTGCYSLKSLNLSNFDTSNVKFFDNMFNGCKSLEYLDISNFETSSAIYTHKMFFDCQALKFLDLSNFDTSKVQDMNSMFLNCYSLTSLELGNFDTSLVTNMTEMFYGCNSLKFLNMKSFNSRSVISSDNMFFNLSISLYCINHDIKEEIKSQLSFYNESTCSELCYANSQKKYIKEKNICINNCYNDEIFIFEYAHICYFECPNGTHLIDDYLCKKNLICNNYYNYEHTDCLDAIPFGYYLNDTEKKTLNKCDIKCSNCTSESVLNNLCISCNNSGGYYGKYNDSLNDNEFINCYNEQPNGYYLDNEKKMYNPCYSSCKACINKGNSVSHQCSECFTDYALIDGNCKLISEAVELTEGITDKITEAETTFEGSAEVIEKSFNSEYIYITEEIKDEESTSRNNIDELTDEGNISDEFTNINITMDKIKKTTEFSYYFDINSNLTELLKDYTNMTFINLLKSDIELIYNIFKLNKENEKIYVLIVDNFSNNTRTATSNYTYRFFLENKTELNLSIINEDNYVDFYVPIFDLELANFNASKYYAEQGFDIYNKSSEFYNDFCTSAHQGENDVTLKDRKKDIYPNNVTLCKNNCIYNGVDIENERIICSCNLNPNIENENDTKEEDDFLLEDDGNFLSYLLDNINYKIFKCYKLLSSFDNLRNNYAFYAILGVFLIIITLNLIFYFHSLPALKNKMIKAAPSNNKVKVKKGVKKELKRIRKSTMNTLKNPTKKKKSTKRKISRKKIEYLNIETNTKKKIYSSKSVKTKVNSLGMKNKKFIGSENRSLEKFLKKKNEIEFELNEENIKNLNDDEINDLVYTQALRIDKRSIFRIFYSLIIQKLEIINLMCNKQNIKIILVSEYILSLLFNFFFNTLLYSDDVVSNKYHNNGELDIIVTLILSLLSNIITSFVCFYLNYSKGIDERLELIRELKIKKYYICNVNIYFRFLKLKFICFFISEIFLVSGCFYYIVIFCIIYNKTTGSLVINYLISLLEGLITSIAITIIILITRKIGLVFHKKDLYNTSKYINNKF